MNWKCTLSAVTGFRKSEGCAALQQKEMTLHTDRTRRRLLANIVPATLVLAWMALVLSTPVWADKKADPPPTSGAETRIKVKQTAIKKDVSPHQASFPKTTARRNPLESKPIENVRKPKWSQQKRDPAPKNTLRQAERLRSQAVQAAREGDFKNALRLIQAAIELKEKSPGVHFDHMVILSWADRFKEAVEKYEQNPVAQRAPDYVRLEIARCYRLTNDFEKAIALYETLLQKRKPSRRSKGLH
jgi:hypothetical protein